MVEYTNDLGTFKTEINELTIKQVNSRFTEEMNHREACWATSRKT